MKLGEEIKPTSRISDRAFYIIAAGLTFLAYLCVFLIVRRDTTVLEAMIASLSNLIPLVLLTFAVSPIIRRALIGSTPLRQVLGHVTLAAAFSFLWHWMITIIYGIRTGGSLSEFTVSVFFPEPALAWQFLQGVTVYALVASLTYMRVEPELPDFFNASAEGWPEPEPSLKRYFIRLDDDIQPIDVSTVISIVGADDYAEVTTVDGQHLVRTTLSKFEASLDPEQFMRVHRSRIVNIDKIDRAESAGDGRMNLHMENGVLIQTSRAGAKALRNLVL